MDNLTHSLAGLALARAGLDRSTRGATLALVLSANLPDIDLIASLAGTAAYLEHHRGVSHSVIGAPLLALGLALLLHLLLRGSRLLPLLGCSLLGVTSHVFIDLWTSYGTRVLEPFDASWLSWDLVFIVDPWVVLLLLLGVVWGRGKVLSARMATVSLGLLLAYVGGRAVLHAQALDQARAQLSGRPLQRIVAVPSPIDPFGWHVVADTGDAYWVGDVDLRGRSLPLLRRKKQLEDAATAQARAKSEVAAVFLDFSSFPWLETQPAPEGTAVVWRDLRFERGDRAGFVARVVVGPDGSILSERFRY